MSASTHPRPVTRPPVIAAAFGALTAGFAAVFIAALVLRPTGETGLLWFSDIALTVAALASGALGLAVALQIREPDRRSWILMSLGSLSWGLGMFAVTWHELVLQQETPVPSVADFGYLAMLPLMVAGLVMLPAPRLWNEARIKASLDAFLVMAGTVTVSWFVVLGPIYSASEGTFAERAIGFAYPAGDVALICSLVVGVSRGWMRGRDPVFGMLLAGIAAFIVADVGFNYLMLHDLYASGSPIDLGWPLGFMLITNATLHRWARRSQSHDSYEEPGIAPPPGHSALRLSTPYVVVLAVTGLLFYSRLAERSGEQHVFVALALVTVISVIARQFVTLQENRRLNRELHSFSQGLEAMVEERTARLTALHSLGSQMSTASTAPQVASLPRAAAQAAAQLLDLEYASVLELQADAGALRFVAGSDWTEDASGRGEVSVDPRTPAGLALSSLQPVIVEDQRTDGRFESLDSYGAGALSGITVVIPQPGRPHGVLSAFSRRARQFTQDDVDFMQSIANALGQTVQRIHAMDELRREHARTEQLLASISSVLVAVGADGRVQLWNRAARDTFQIEPDAVLGRPFREQALGWSWSGVEDAVTRCLEGLRVVRVDEVRCVRPDGSELFLSLGVNPVTDDEGALSGYLLIGVDVTERRSLEEQLTQAQRLEAIGQLAAGIAHELNAPTQYVGDHARFLAEAFRDLEGLLAKYAQLLEARRVGPPPVALVASVREAAGRADSRVLTAEIPRALEQSLDGVERVSEIVRVMKEFSHPGSIARTPVDLNRAIESTVTVARNVWTYVADVEMDFDATLPLVPCLPGEFNQAILNVVINAAHAIAEVVREDGEERGTITVSTRNDGDWAEIRIADTGSGIPEAIRKHVLDPFFTTKNVGKGTGHGLAIVRSVIVDKHNGQLAFETAEGRGTTFIIRLPIRSSAAVAA